MAKREKNKVKELVGQLIESELETHLSRMVKKAKKRAVRESAKLKDFLQLPYVKESEVIEAEVVEQSADNEDSTLKKTSLEV